MKSTKECYEALLRGETLVRNCGTQVKINGGGLQVSRKGDCWVPDNWAFAHPEEWSIYKGPPKFVSLPVEDDQ